LRREEEKQSVYMRNRRGEKTRAFQEAKKRSVLWSEKKKKTVEVWRGEEEREGRALTLN